MSLPVYYQHLQRACIGSAECGNRDGALTQEQLQALSTAGLSASAYAAGFTSFFALTIGTWCVVGFLLFWHRSDDWLALLAAFFLVTNGITLSNNAVYALTLTFPILDVPLGLLYFLAQVSIGLVSLLFPNGRLVPRWMRLIVLLNILYAFVDTLPSRVFPFDTSWPDTLFYIPVNLVIFGAIIFSQVYRYRHISTPRERQQIKWVVFAGLATSATLITRTLSLALVPSLSHILVWKHVWTISLPLAGLSIPLALGFSMSRYRLYDIDVLINRTLVYGTLTISLGLISATLVIGFGAFLRLVMGQIASSPVVIVASTLSIAALFQPLRHRIQSIIDRRFYRRKYDAAKTIAAFGATCQQQVDLATLSSRLIAVVNETMQPTQVWLWVRTTEHSHRPPTDASDRGDQRIASP